MDPNGNPLKLTVEVMWHAVADVVAHQIAIETDLQVPGSFDSDDLIKTDTSVFSSVTVLIFLMCVSIILK